MQYPNSPAARRVRLRRLTRVAVFLALSLALHLVESTILPPLPVPGAKLGLANLATLVILHLEGTKAAFAVSLGRVVLGSLFGGTFLGLAFWPTLAGAVAATSIMALIKRIPSFGPVGVSVAGALAHNMGQLAAVYPFFPHAGLLYYLPFLVLLALPAGAVNGIIGERVLAAAGRIVKNPHPAAQAGPAAEPPAEEDDHVHSSAASSRPPHARE